MNKYIGCDFVLDNMVLGSIVDTTKYGEDPYSRLRDYGELSLEIKPNKRWFEYTSRITGSNTDKFAIVDWDERKIAIIDGFPIRGNFINEIVFRLNGPIVFNHLDDNHRIN